MPRKNKSTHKGHCQACGRLQMLPAGVLAKHGYNIVSGFFSGTCCGSGHLPYEQSKDLLASLIISAKEDLNRHEDWQKELRAPAKEPKCWIHHWNEKGGVGSRRGWGGYSWEHVTLRFKDPSQNYSYFCYNLRDNSEDKIFTLYDGSTISDEKILEKCTEKNIAYADYLMHHVVSLKRYIEWQEGRVNSWKLLPLLPVETVDKAGFVPEKAPY